MIGIDNAATGGSEIDLAMRSELSGIVKVGGEN